MKTPATCHPNRAVHARGLCKSCYNSASRRRVRAQRGPADRPYIPAGHELSGVSSFSDASGELQSRWDKTRIHGADEAPHDPVPEGHAITSTATMKRGDGTTIVQWVRAEPDREKRDAAMREAWKRHAAEYSGLAGRAPDPEIGVVSSPLSVVVPIGDPHIGLLAWDRESGDNFDTKIAVSDLIACIKRLIDSTAVASEIVLAELGDFFHAQDDSARTPGHGNVLSVDDRYAKVLDLGHAMLRSLTDYALRRHGKVRWHFIPGNHDPRVAVELSYWMRAVYEREPRVVVEDAFAALQYYRHGKVLIGLAHGHTAPMAELPGIMATDRPDDWGECTERVWHTGHVHHLSRKEFAGCVVESHRTLAAKDAWHAARYRSARSLCAITYHEEHGEIARATVGLGRIRRRP